jgi:hypothetical protein
MDLFSQAVLADLHSWPQIVGQPSQMLLLGVAESFHFHFLSI